MNIYISVVCHGHAELIKKLSVIEELSREFKVVIKANLLSENMDFFRDNENVFLIEREYGRGFSFNNNLVFKYCEDKLGMKDKDYFLVLNPDVLVSSETILELMDILRLNRFKLATINLYKDMDFEVYDNSVRNFPKLIDFFMSYIMGRNKTILDKSFVDSNLEVDWAAGSFLIFQVKHYRKLRGFDETYFMYCEDIDVCFRSFMHGEPLIYIPSLKAVHLAKHGNRKLFSPHFIWHISSVVKYLLSKHHLRKPKSSIVIEGEV
ncbi:glycosyltransferase family 2 protein [Vibrio vulnificus]|uniref:glycosyltransferase family 2 protein n=1 Tax=Vibrio vulnificus TaxID=672 RepID=UPI000CD0D8D7|nr:glycosyltransferase family 2 protein [Vibrio vulnificus]POC14872.1 glycosyl transferase family 2 [Vibrio vulnificus]